MVLSALTLLAFFHFGISSSIAMDNEPEQDPTALRQQLEQNVYPQSDDDEEGVKMIQQTARSDQPSLKLEEKPQSSAWLVIKYLFGYASQEEGKKAQEVINRYNPFYIDYELTF